MSEDGWKAIARLRRAQPRNPDTMAVCDAYEAAVRYVRELEERLARQPAKATFDKKAYMREYMRRRRARAKGTTTQN